MGLCELVRIRIRSQLPDYFVHYALDYMSRRAK